MIYKIKDGDLFIHDNKKYICVGTDFNMIWGVEDWNKESISFEADNCKKISMFTLQNENNTYPDHKSLTFDKAGQNALPQHIKDKMKVNQNKANENKALELEAELADFKSIASQLIRLINRKYNQDNSLLSANELKLLNGAKEVSGKYFKGSDILRQSEQSKPTEINSAEEILKEIPASQVSTGITASTSLNGCPFHYCDGKIKCVGKCKYA